jgi:hypothetical protein
MLDGRSEIEADGTWLENTRCRLIQDKQSIAWRFGGAVEAFPAIRQLIL